MSREPDIQLFNRDCMEAMAEMPDKAFDLAIVDPPYGIHDRLSVGGGPHTKSRGVVNFHNLYNKKGWDKKPAPEYFEELFRVSKNQVIWGGNYFPELWTRPQRGYIVWHKDSFVKNFSTMEMAWTSFDRLPQYYYYAWGGSSDGIRGRNKKEKSIHPTQKPVALYRWLLDNYASPGDKILDTHLGSMSIAIACHDAGFDLVGYEIDPDYYREGVERFERHKSQQKLFTAEEIRPVPVQLKIIE